MGRWAGFFVVIAVLVGCQSPVSSSGKVKVRGVSVAPNSLSLVVAGATGTLTAAVNPSDAEDKGVSWGSSAPSVATVSAQGVVTPVAAGSATITVTTNDGSFQATASVTVTSGAVAYRIISGRLVYTQSLSNIIPHIVIKDSNIVPYADIPIYLAETGATVTTDENGDFTFTSVDPAFSTYHLVMYDDGEGSVASEYAVQTIEWQSSYGTSYSLPADWDQKTFSNRYHLQLVDGESEPGFVGGIRASLYNNATDELIAEDWSDPASGDISFWSDFWVTDEIYRVDFSGATGFVTFYLWRADNDGGYDFNIAVDEADAGLNPDYSSSWQSTEDTSYDFGAIGPNGPVQNEVMTDE